MIVPADAETDADVQAGNVMQCSKANEGFNASRRGLPEKEREYVNRDG